MLKSNKNCKNVQCAYHTACRQYEAKWCVWVMDSIDKNDLYDIDAVAEYNGIQVWRS